MSLPPLATAEATIAICSGVTVSLSWPMAMRPTSTAPLVAGTTRPCTRSPLAARSSRGRSTSTGRPKPRRSMYFFILALPSFSPISPNTVLTDLVSASVRVMSPKDSPPSLLRGTPEIVLPLRPLMRESGV